MEPTSQAATTAPQVSSAPQTAVAPSSASQFATSAPSTSQVSQTMAPQVWANPAPQASPQAPAPQASAAAPSAGNPWQEAFQALSASLNTSYPSQTQAPYSAQVTPTYQANTQAQWASAAPQMSAPQAAPTYSPQVSTQTYAAPQQAQTAPQQSAPASAPDSYLSQISDQSLEVLEHFGAEAPALLNNYACAVEDALIEQVQRGQQMDVILNAAGEERAAMNLMLTDPDVLADYVNDFFGPEGPYPTMTAEEEAAANQMAARQQFEAEIEAQAQNQVPPNFQRPEQEMPQRGVNQGTPAQSFWGDFSQLMDNNPEQAWQYLAQAPQGALQTKALIQDL